MSKRIPADSHEIFAQLRELRQATGLSLAQLEARTGHRAIVVGSWERGDRHPTVEALDELLRVYGRRLAIVPIDEPGAPKVWTDDEMVSALRGIAARLEGDQAVMAALDVVAGGEAA